jgi:hypothetical protein
MSNFKPILGGEFLTRAQLAVELGISERILARWDLAREGPPRTVLSRRPLYRRDAVMEWAKAREETQPRASA